MRLGGLEPPTFGSANQRSIQLSYRRFIKHYIFAKLYKLYQNFVVTLMNESSEGVKIPDQENSLFFGLLKSIGVSKNVFKNQEVCLPVLENCFFDPGSKEPLSSLPDSDLEIIKANLPLYPELISRYDNQELPSIRTLSSGILRLLLKHGYQVVGNRMVDINSVYNANAISLVDPSLQGRLNGDRTVRQAQSVLSGVIKGSLLLRWGGDEFMFLHQNPPEMEPKDFEQLIALLRGPESFFYEKGLLSQKPISFKTDKFDAEEVTSRPYLEQTSQNIEEIKTRIDELRKKHPQTTAFFANLEISSNNLDSLNILLEILENSYYDPLLYHESLKLISEFKQKPETKLREINTFMNVAEFATFAAQKDKPQSLLLCTIPNGLRLANNISHQYGDQKLIEFFSLLVKQADLPEFNLLRRGPDFYLLVDQEKAEVLEAKLTPIIDEYSQTMLPETLPDGTKITIPHGVVDSAEPDFTEDDLPIEALGKAMSDINQATFSQIKLRQKQYLQKNSLTEGVKNYLVDYYSLLLKRGFPRIQQIFKNLNITKDLADEYQALGLLKANNPAYQQAKNKILELILSGLELDSSDVKMES